MEIPYNLAGARVNAPLLVLTHHLSPGGGTSSGAMLCYAYEVQGQAESKLPPPGEVPLSGDRGAFPRAKEARSACFPLAPKARLSGFIIRGALPYFRAPATAAKQPIKFAAKPPPQPFPLLVLRTTFPPAHRSGDKRKAPLFSRVPLRGTPRSGKGCTEVRMMMLL